MDERTLEDLLECSVCLERLDHASKVLPCQHTFCRKCLEVIVSSHSELRCPECRVLVELKIEDLPPNVLLMRILEGMKNTSQTLNNSNTTNSVTTEFVSLSTLNNKQPIQQLNQINGNNNAVGVHVNLNSRDPLENCYQQFTQRNDHQAILKLGEEMHNNHGSNPSKRQSEGLLSQNSNNKQSLENKLMIPYAKALYDFDSKDSGDLNFKKGDKIILRRRIDTNWFAGECNGNEGVFPINYVQIMIPLSQPQSKAQCKALYDFRMGSNEEEGCLSFKKGAIINVMRRVDQNWAEGRIDGETIGIFPIAFVEMNSHAKQLIEAPTMNFALGQRNLPPTPNEQQLNNFPSGSKLMTAAPVSSSFSSISNTAPPNGDTKNGQSTPNMTLFSNASSSANDKLNSLNNTLNTSCAGNLSSNNAGKNSNRHPKDIQSNVKVKLPSTQKHSKPYHSMGKSGGSKISQRYQQNSQTVSNISNAFIALYSYKPQQPDELELKKGSIYYVKDYCQDGWFKGINRTQKSGVFPGNYLVPYGATATGSAQHVQKRSASSSYGNNTNASVADKSSNIYPPELPPRSADGSSSSSGWSKPIGQHMEALFGRSQPVNLIKRITNIKKSKSPVNNSTPSYSMDNPVFEDNPLGCSEPLGGTITSKRNTIHLRSGSCPSQLLQVNLGSKSGNTGAVVNKAEMFNSQRVKSHKERGALHGMTYELGATCQSLENSPPSYHRNIQSLDAAAIVSQITTNFTESKKKSYAHNEKFKCIVSYPPNSEFELELTEGDIVYVHKKRNNGWYKGTHASSGKVGLFPSSFVEPI